MFKAAKFINARKLKFEDHLEGFENKLLVAIDRFYKLISKQIFIYFFKI